MVIIRLKRYTILKKVTNPIPDFITIALVKAVKYYEFIKD